MIKTSILAIALLGGVLGFVGGVLTVMSGSAQGWASIVGGVSIFAFVTFEWRRSPR